MKLSTFRELLKTFAVLALDLLGLFAILALIVAVGVTTVISVVAIFWFYFQLLF